MAALPAAPIPCLIHLCRNVLVTFCLQAFVEAILHLMPTQVLDSLAQQGSAGAVAPRQEHQVQISSKLLGTDLLPLILAELCSTATVSPTIDDICQI